jgi:hypothetical protein
MFENITLHEMNLSVRARTALTYGGLRTLDVIASKTGWELLRLPNFGQRSLNEVRDVLKSYGLKLKDNQLSKPDELLTIEHSIEYLDVVQRLDRIERLLLKLLGDAGAVPDRRVA